MHREQLDVCLERPSKDVIKPEMVLDRKKVTVHVLNNHLYVFIFQITAILKLALKWDSLSLKNETEEQEGITDFTVVITEIVSKYLHSFTHRHHLAI